jgi:DNA topoisomerase-3
MRVIVAEKPSVARDLAGVLGARRSHQGWIEGEDLAITWCIGHLLELEDPAHYDAAWKNWRLDVLPMIPPAFALRVRKGGEDQFEVVRKLLRDKRTTEVINACDAGREGELIFRYVWQFAGGKAPVRRLWVSSMTDQAIREGLRTLQPAQRYDRLADAARCRSEADWLVGLNATRAMTCRSRAEGGDGLWSIGRVQTPTLAMIVRRDHEIASFVPETYWQVKAKLAADAGCWTATWFRDGVAPKAAARPEAEVEDADAPVAERLTSLEAAEAVVRASAGRTGEVARSRRSEKRERPPLLYDLTALQRRANQRYGMSAQDTLDVAQALYERHKLITYPRTDARFLTSDQVGELPGILTAVATLPTYSPFVQTLTAAPLRTSRMVDDAEVGDHHAILPTNHRPDPSQLSPAEKRIYDLVVRRLLAALSPDAVFDMAEIVVAVPPDPAVSLPDDVPSPLTFRARGRVLREVGWRAVDPPGASKDVELPAVRDGDAVAVTEVKAHESQTRPPRPHDDSSLLGAMETAGKDIDDAEIKRALRNAGLGTPATRAAILQTLVERAYIERDGRALRSTEKGRALIGAIPLEELKSAELTGRWEKRLSDVAEGKETREVFMNDVNRHLHGVIDALRTVPMPEEASRRTRPEAEAIGVCPACHTPVRLRGPVYDCETGRDCPFLVFSTMGKRAISPAMVKELLKNGKTKSYKGFRSKSGNPFEAGLELQPDGKVVMWFPPWDDAARPPQREAEAPKGASEGSRGREPRDPNATRPRRVGSSAGPPPNAPAGRPTEKAPRSRAPKADKPKINPLPPPLRPGDACPVCGVGHIIQGRAALGCDRWREGCGWRGPLP